MTRIVQSLALAGIAALAAACSHRPPAGTAESDTGQDDSSAVSVQIISHNSRSVEVALDTGVGRRQLMVLAAHGVRAFTIPLRSLAGSKRVRLTARRVGDRREVSRVSVAVAPGAVVVWTLEPNLAFSSVSVD
jgi:hypothetical protein